MVKNPYTHAVLAAIYIIAVVFGIHTGSRAASGEDNLLMPMAFLSLFVLSAAIMGYLFVFEPLRLYLEGKKEEGVGFFLKTLAAFAGLTLLILAAAYFSTR